MFLNVTADSFLCVICIQTVLLVTMFICIKIYDLKYFTFTVLFLGYCFNQTIKVYILICVCSDIYYGYHNY